MSLLLIEIKVRIHIRFIRKISKNIPRNIIMKLCVILFFHFTRKRNESQMRPHYPQDYSLQINYSRTSFMSAVSRLINDVEPSRTSTCLKRCTTSRRAETFYRKSARILECTDQTRIDQIPRRNYTPPSGSTRDLNFVFTIAASWNYFDETNRLI